MDKQDISEIAKRTEFALQVNQKNMRIADQEIKRLLVEKYELVGQIKLLKEIIQKDSKNEEKTVAGGEELVDFVGAHKKPNNKGGNKNAQENGSNDS